MRSRRVLLAGILVVLVLPLPLVAHEAVASALTVGAHVLVGQEGQVLGLALRSGILLVLLGVGLLVGIPLVLAAFVPFVLYPLCRSVSRAVRSAVASARTANPRATLRS